MREQEQQPEPTPEPETPPAPVQPEPSREDLPPLEPDSYVPDDRAPPPEHDVDFEMGD